jgi:hypothetical protein
MIYTLNMLKPRSERKGDLQKVSYFWAKANQDIPFKGVGVYSKTLER